MKSKEKKIILVGAMLLVAFVIWTVLVCAVDVREIGPGGSRVGFATLNEAVFKLTGVNFTLYEITDYLGLVPMLIALAYATIGFIQLIKRKSIKRVDAGVLLLGALYITVFAVFALFETLKLNYRPVLINGVLEASYPSSTTMLVISTVPTVWAELSIRVKSRTLKAVISTLCPLFTVFMILGRLLSGVHWVTDIIGGALFSTGIAIIYIGALRLINIQK